MTEIIEFLLARIAEDEREANAWLNLYKRGQDGTPRRWVRVLAECTAKRAIMGACESVLADLHNYEGTPLAEATLRTLAAVYSDHPGYRQEWND